MISEEKLEVFGCNSGQRMEKEEEEEGHRSIRSNIGERGHEEEKEEGKLKTRRLVLLCLLRDKEVNGSKV